MTSRDFVYWFQGFLEIGKVEQINKEQLEVVRTHINMVFAEEIDPSHRHPKQLDAIHNPSLGVKLRC